MATKPAITTAVSPRHPRSACDVSPESLKSLRNAIARAPHETKTADASVLRLAATVATKTKEQTNPPVATASMASHCQAFGSSRQGGGVPHESSHCKPKPQNAPTRAPKPLIATIAIASTVDAKRRSTPSGIGFEGLRLTLARGMATGRLAPCAVGGTDFRVRRAVEGRYACAYLGQAVNWTAGTAARRLTPGRRRQHLGQWRTSCQVLHCALPDPSGS